MIRIEEDKETKKMFFVDGNERTEIVDPEIAGIFKNLERVKGGAKALVETEKGTPSASGTPEGVSPLGALTQFVSGNVLVLLSSALAAICSRQQDLQADVDELIEDGVPASLEGHVVIPLPELEKALEPLQAAVQVIFHVTQGLPNDSPEQQQAKALHQKLTQDLATFVNAMVYKVQAIHEAEAEEDEEDEPEAEAPSGRARGRRA